MPSPEATFDAAAAALAGEGVRPGRRLDFLTRALILKYQAQHPEKSSHAVAVDLGHDPRSVAAVLGNQGADIKELTRQLLATEVIPSLEDWVTARTKGADKGDHRGAQAMLVAAGAIDPPQVAGASINVGFQVVVAPRPGLPDYQVNELPAAGVTRVSAPASHVQAQAPSAMPEMRPTDPALSPPDANVPAYSADVSEPVLTTAYAQRAPLTTHPPTAPTIPPAHTSMRQRPRTRLRR